MGRLDWWYDLAAISGSDSVVAMAWVYAAACAVACITGAWPVLTRFVARPPSALRHRALCCHSQASPRGFRRASPLDGLSVRSRQRLPSRTAAASIGRTRPAISRAYLKAPVALRVPRHVIPSLRCVEGLLGEERRRRAVVGVADRCRATSWTASPARWAGLGPVHWKPAVDALKCPDAVAAWAVIGRNSPVTDVHSAVEPAVTRARALSPLACQCRQRSDHVTFSICPTSSSLYLYPVQTFVIARK